jgi:hypothetical protein
MKLKNFLFGDSTKNKTLGNKFRQKRMGFFKEKIKDLAKPIRILYIDEILLPSENKFNFFFPNIKICKEKFLFMTKSFVAHNFNN